MNKRIYLTACCALLNACGGEDLHDWPAKTQHEIRRNLNVEKPQPPAAEINQSASGTETGGAEKLQQNVPDAFDQGRLKNAAVDNDEAENNARSASETADTAPAAQDEWAAWHYVGSVQNGKRRTALLEKDGYVYRIAPGGTLGKGKLTAVETDVVTVKLSNGRTVKLPKYHEEMPSEKDGKRRSAKQNEAENEEAEQ
ncbi:MAG: hypothetical protein Q4D82_03235 [Neisseria sp.]|nr:hypothetical protein [Neisseria sp.]